MHRASEIVCCLANSGASAALRTAVLGAEIAMIRFDVSALVEARPGAALSLVVDTGPECLDDVEVGFLRGTIEVTRVESGLLLQGTVESQVRIECVRCLDSYLLPVNLEVEETYGLPGSIPGEGMPYSVSSSGWLDLSPLLRELSWLEVPLKPLCGPSCRGFCPRCGEPLGPAGCTCAERMVDPRWAALKDLVL
jgi:uncharacterized protein